VQIGAFSDERNAIALKADLLRRYPATQVIEFPGPTGYWVRIKTAQADREWMTQLSTAIKPAEPGAEAWLLRLD
jgi:rare lipoprotein A